MIKEFVTRIYSFLNQPIVFCVMCIIFAFVCADALLKIYDLWKYEKEQEKKQNEDISVSALDNNKDR